MRTLIKDYGLGNFKITIETDASAGKGIAMRLGAGKLKRLGTQWLWSQHVFYDRFAEVKKIQRQVEELEQKMENQSKEMEKKIEMSVEKIQKSVSRSKKQTNEKMDKMSEKIDQLMALIGKNQANND